MILYKNSEKGGSFILFGAKNRLRLTVKRTSKRKRTVAFVDYEHWYYSLNNLYGIRPNVRAWRDMLAEKYDITAIYFFGDFSNPYIRAEISKIREVSNFIIETQNSYARQKKDFTDFIMLDHIYQSAIDSDKHEAFIIFTGDGHFSSVVSYLVTKCRKEVGIYAVRDALSNQLKNSATYFVTFPTDEDIEIRIKRMIISAIDSVYADNPKPRPTYVATIDAVSNKHGISRDSVAKAMSELVESGCVYQKRIRVSYDKSIKILAVNRELAAELENPENDGTLKL